MSDIYDEGGFKGVPDAMNFLVNGIFAIAGRPIYHHVYIRGECYEIIRNQRLHVAVRSCSYVEAVFYRTPFGVQSLTMPRRSKSLTIKDFHYGISMLMYSQWGSWHSATLLMQDMLHFLPQYLVDYYQQHCRGKDDMLIQLGITFQRSMYCHLSSDSSLAYSTLSAR